jgi:hypothetical protein
LKSLAAVPVPASLTSLFGGGGAAVTTGLALKAAAALSVGALVGGGGYESVHRVIHHKQTPAPAANKLHTSTPVVAGTPVAPLDAQSSRAAVAQDVSRAAAHHKRHAKPHLTYHGDASVAARHVDVPPKVGHVSRGASSAHAAHPAHPVVSHRPATPPGHAKPKSAHVKKSLPGPFDSSAGNGGAAGAAHGKGK